MLTVFPTIPLLKSGETDCIAYMSFALDKFPTIPLLKSGETEGS